MRINSHKKNKLQRLNSFESYSLRDDYVMTINTTIKTIQHVIRLKIVRSYSNLKRYQNKPYGRFIACLRNTFSLIPIQQA